MDKRTIQHRNNSVIFFQPHFLSIWNILYRGTEWLGERTPTKLHFHEINILLTRVQYYSPYIIGGFFYAPSSYGYPSYGYGGWQFHYWIRFLRNNSITTLFIPKLIKTIVKTWPLGCISKRNVFMNIELICIFFLLIVLGRMWWKNS
jgi:hypothetical protein